MYVSTSVHTYLKQASNLYRFLVAFACYNNNFLKMFTFDRKLWKQKQNQRDRARIKAYYF